MKRSGALALLALTFARAGEARADEPRDPSTGLAELPVGDRPVTGAVLPDNLVPHPKNYWVTGVALERFSTRDDTITSLDHFLVGVTTMWRLGQVVAPHALLMATPSTAHQNWRLLSGLGLRGYFTIPGFTELSAGAGAHLEARLKDHYWLAYLTPIEVGGVVLSNRSFDMEVFVGVRRVIAGHLINNFLIDPNGFDNEDAQNDLEYEKGEGAWKGFIRIQFGRRLD